MLKITDYLAAISETVSQNTEIRSVRLVADDKGMSDYLRSLPRDQMPALFVVVPFAEDRSTGPDNVKELNSCILFLMDRTDPQRRTAMETVIATQPLMERLKGELRRSAACPCSLLYGLSNLQTTPETGLYTEYSGWSVSFNILSHE